MTITVLIIGIIIGIAISYYLFNIRIKDNIELKEKSLEVIINLLEEKGEISNSEVRDILNISSRTVVRYMDELEEQGRVEQIGETGASVVYRLK